MLFTEFRKEGSNFYRHLPIAHARYRGLGEYNECSREGRALCLKQTERGEDTTFNFMTVYREFGDLFRYHNGVSTHV